MPLLKVSRRSFPFVERAFADTAYVAGRAGIEIARRPPGQVGFAAHLRRWVVDGASPD